MARPITIHKLRHTTGTLLSKAGVPIQTIQKILGHSDIKVTAKHYQRLNTRDQRRAMEQNLVFENLPSPTAEPVFTFQSRSAGSQKDEGRDPPVPRAKSRPSESGRQDLNLRPLGPERPQDDSHAASGCETASHPVDLSGISSAAGSHGEAPIAPQAMPFGAPVARLGRGAEAWIAPAEVAARLKVGRATVYALVKSGQLRHRRIGLQIRVPLSALEDFLVGSQ